MQLLVYDENRKIRRWLAVEDAVGTRHMTQGLPAGLLPASASHVVRCVNKTLTVLTYEPLMLPHSPVLTLVANRDHVT
jgi:hypothetical protein